VLHLATLARNAGCDGTVASPREARWLRVALGPDWLIVTPGIRPRSAGSDDQVRVATAAAARESGADLVVVGRPITTAAEPAAVARTILAELAG